MILSLLHCYYLDTIVSLDNAFRVYAKPHPGLELCIIHILTLVNVVYNIFGSFSEIFGSLRLSSSSATFGHFRKMCVDCD